MEHHNKMDREQFYRELCTVLGREGFHHAAGAG